MSCNHTKFPAHFVPYETNRITCDFENESDYLQAMESLKIEGFDDNGFYILQGTEGIRALDPTGTEHGLLAMIKRKIHAMISEAEEHSIEDMIEDLENGMIHLSVPAAHKNQRDIAHKIMDDANGQKIKFMGMFYVETYSRVS